jgi:hypothetical protein
LVRQDRPSFRQLSEKRDRDLVPYFVVRGAKVEYLEEPVRWGEMFGTIYEPSPVSDGVPELLPQSPIGQALGNETEVMMFARGNAQTIRDIVREDSPETRLVLARRMADPELAEPLRLLYAAILAALNDDRGREFLSNCVESPKPVNLNVLYCLGEFPSFASEKCPVRPMVTFRRTLHGPRNT